jgi:site-specific recombinase XerD
LSDSYFKLEDERWVPQVVDDLTLFARVLRGGRKLKHWGLREECVTRILFESGCRVSEAVGLTLGDWVAWGMTREATAFSKGSHGRRIKFLRFSNETAKLLRRYFDGERRYLDPQGYSLEEYLREAKAGQRDLYTIPLFLSRQRTMLSAKTYVSAVGIQLAMQRKLTLTFTRRVTGMSPSLFATFMRHPRPRERFNVSSRIW